MAEQCTRKVSFKVYDRSGVFVKVLDDVLTEPEWDWNVNGGLGETSIKLDRKLGDYGEGTDIGLNYRIKIYLNDAYNENKLIYSGYISAFKPYLTDRAEGVEIVVLPNVSKLKNDYWRTSTSVLTGFANQETTKDVTDVFKDILNNYRLNGETDLLISNDWSYVGTTGSVITYLFKDLKHLDAIKKLEEFLPSDWYWFLDADGKLHLKVKDATPTHTFVLNKTIKELQTHKNIEEVINHFFIWSGKGSESPNYVDEDYFDTTSKNAYGTIADELIDSDVHTAAYAALIGNPKISENKDAKNQVTLIIGKDYDLASIKPGDTCKISNVDEDQTIFGTNMSIVKIRYKLDEVILELTDVANDLSKLTQEREDLLEYVVSQQIRTLSDLSPDNLSIGNRGWVSNIVFSSSDYRSVAWTAGQIKIATSDPAAPTTYNIDAGSATPLSQTVVIYLDPVVSATVLQTSTTFSAGLGPKRIAIAYAVPNADTAKNASIVPVVWGYGMKIDGGNIALRTVLAEQIGANEITSYEITTDWLTALRIRTAASPATRIELESTGGYANNILFYYGSTLAGQISSVGGLWLALLSPQSPGLISLATTDGISFNATGTGNSSKTIVPVASATHSLGSSSYYWKYFYLSDVQYFPYSTASYIQHGSYILFRFPADSVQIDVGGDLVPVTNDNNFLGTSSYKWYALYSDFAVIDYLGQDLNANTYNITNVGILDLDTDGYIKRHGASYVRLTASYFDMYVPFGVFYTASDPSNQKGGFFFSTSTGRFRGNDTGGASWRDLCFYDERNVASPIPTFKSGLQQLKRIGKPSLKDGKLLFETDAFPEEFHAKKGKNSESHTDLLSIIGMLIQSQKELAEQVELLKGGLQTP